MFLFWVTKTNLSWLRMLHCSWPKRKDVALYGSKSKFDVGLHWFCSSNTVRCGPVHSHWVKCLLSPLLKLLEILRRKVSSLDQHMFWRFFFYFFLFCFEDSYLSFEACKLAAIVSACEIFSLVYKIRVYLCAHGFPEEEDSVTPLHRWHHCSQHHRYLKITLYIYIYIYLCFAVF